MISLKKYKFLFLTIFFVFQFCKNPIEQKCELTCTFAEQCAINALRTISIDPESMEKIHLQCLGACTMFQQEFLSCKEQSQNSCKEFYECILSAGVFN